MKILRTSKLLTIEFPLEVVKGVVTPSKFNSKQSAIISAAMYYSNRSYDASKIYADVTCNANASCGFQIHNK